MKKLIASICTLALILAMSVTAAAEIDLSGMSWQELIDLRAAVTMEQMSRDEWQEVEVPQGVWKVGEDIPAGKWTIKCTVGSRTGISWGDKLDESGADISWDGHVYEFEGVYNPNSKYYSAGDRTELELELKDGWYVIIESSSATFTPFTGKPSLGFK